jgi:hypothetical protein
MDANNKVGFLDALLRRQLAWPAPLWLLLAAHGIVNIALGFLLIAFLGDILARLKTIRPQSGPIIFAFQCTIVPLFGAVIVFTIGGPFYFALAELTEFIRSMMQR